VRYLINPVIVHVIKVLTQSVQIMKQPDICRPDKGTLLYFYFRQL